LPARGLDPERQSGKKREKKAFSAGYEHEFKRARLAACWAGLRSQPQLEPRISFHPGIAGPAIGILFNEAGQRCCATHGSARTSIATFRQPANRRGFLLVSRSAPAIEVGMRGNASLPLNTYAIAMTALKQANMWTFFNQFQRQMPISFADGCLRRHSLAWHCLWTGTT
jgi:hypothetical protein